jgi:tetratricopeptide (TPR) repeat protein
LVLLLEDLHWSDPSTLELIATIARRTEPARLLILGTYRPVEMLAGDHPLRTTKEELELHQHCIELRLPLLSEADVAAYLTQRFGDGKAIPRTDSARNDGGLEPIDRVAPIIHARTEGNPLFMVNIIDYLLEQGSLLDVSRVEAPRNIRQMIERNLQRLTADEQRMLEAASVVGAEFSAASIAAALERPLIEVEACCTGLARREQFVRAEAASHWPDGTMAASYRFLHALYSEVLYERVPVGSRAELHRRIAEREELAYGDRCDEIAAELAYHYRQAPNVEKAVHFLRSAAEQAAARAAYAEAFSHLTTGLDLLKTLPQGVARDREELRMQLALGFASIVVKGTPSNETEATFSRAYELCRSGGESAEFVRASVGLTQVHIFRGEMQKAREASKEILEVAARVQDPAIVAVAYNALGFVLHFQAELSQARERLEQALALFKSVPELSGWDRLQTLVGLGRTLWLLGFPDQALTRTREAEVVGQRGTDPQLKVFGFGLTLTQQVHLWCGNFDVIREQVQKLLDTPSATLNPGILSTTDILRGWLIAREGQAQGIALIRGAMAKLAAIRSSVYGSLFGSLLAEACASLGRIDEAMTVLDETLPLAETEQHYYEAELRRLRGELLLLRPQADREGAERCFREAIDIARRQSAKSWELRSTTSLARLLAKQSKGDEARAMLAEIYGWFTEGFDTADLKDAKALLGELA